MTDERTFRLLLAITLIVVALMGFYLFYSWKNCSARGGVLVLGVPVLQCVEPRR